MINGRDWKAVGQALENLGEQCNLDIKNLVEDLDEYPELVHLYSWYAQMVNALNAGRASIQALYEDIVER